MLLDRKKLVETSYFFIADIVEGLDTSLAYSRGGFIPNFKNLDDLEGKHSEQQTRLGGEGTSDIWAEEWSKFWVGNPILKFEDAVKESEAERNRRCLEEYRDMKKILAKIIRKENNVSFLRPEEAFRGYKPIIFYRFKIPEIDIMEEGLFSMQYYDPEEALEYEIITEEDLGFSTYQWLYEMELNRLVSFTFSIHGYWKNLCAYLDSQK